MDDLGFLIWAVVEDKQSGRLDSHFLHVLDLTHGVRVARNDHALAGLRQTVELFPENLVCDRVVHRKGLSVIILHCCGTDSAAATHQVTSTSACACRCVGNLIPNLFSPRSVDSVLYWVPPGSKLVSTAPICLRLICYPDALSNA